MKQLTPLILIIYGTIVALHGEMYDPFQKTITMKKRNQPAPLLMPLPPLLPTNTVVVAPLSVSAVMNHRAFIDGSWIGIGERVRNKEVVAIQNDFVTLKEGNRLLMLGVGSQRHILKTKEVR